MNGAGVLPDPEKSSPLSSCQQPPHYRFSQPDTKLLFPSLKFHVQIINSIYIYSIFQSFSRKSINPLKPELNPICYLLALLGAHNFLHVSRIRVKLLTLR